MILTIEQLCRKIIQTVNLNLVFFPLQRFQNHSGENEGGLQHKFYDNDMPFLAG